MDIQFEVTLRLDQDYIDHEYMHREDGKSPQVGTIISDALEAIDCSHRFGVDLTAKNIVVTTKLNDINTDTSGL